MQWCVFLLLSDEETKFVKSFATYIISNWKTFSKEEFLILNYRSSYFSLHTKITLPTQGRDSRKLLRQTYFQGFLVVKEFK